SFNRPLCETLTGQPNHVAPATAEDGSGTLWMPDQHGSGQTERVVPNVPGQCLSTLRPGDHLEKYRILDVLGQGGMGVVFKAQDTVLQRTVAIKVPGPLLANNPAAQKRFIREGQTAAAVKDQHVVTVYGVEGHESPFLVLEYVEGKSLEELLSRSA